MKVRWNRECESIMAVCTDSSGGYLCKVKSQLSVVIYWLFVTLSYWTKTTRQQKTSSHFLSFSLFYLKNSVEFYEAKSIKGAMLETVFYTLYCFQSVALTFLFYSIPWMRRQSNVHQEIFICDSWLFQCLIIRMSNQLRDGSIESEGTKTKNKKREKKSSCVRNRVSSVN